MPMHFRDRLDAGEKVASAVKDRGIDVDLVLAIPRGGLPLGRAVADALEVPLDVVVAKKIGAPGNPEFAIGAVASDGSVWRNEEGLAGIDEEYFERKRREEAENARAKAAQYRQERDPPEIERKRVLLVDDGVATGSTVRACIKQLQHAGAESVMLAVPVGPPGSIRELEEMVDEMVCLETPADFMGVGQFYDRFDQVSDAEAMDYLD